MAIRAPVTAFEYAGDLAGGRVCAAPLPSSWCARAAWVLLGRVVSLLARRAAPLRRHWNVGGASQGVPERALARLLWKRLDVIGLHAKGFAGWRCAARPPERVTEIGREPVRRRAPAVLALRARG